MNYISHADLGGRQVEGNVLPEAEGELWHASWEPRVLALTLAMGATGAWNIDQSRSARETLPDYATLSYYRIWLAGLQRLLEDRELVSADELAAGHAQQAAPVLPRRLASEQVAAALAKGSPTERVSRASARFVPGDRVITSALQPDHHSRLPAYARGKPGIVERVHGVHVFADSNAQGLGEQPQWLYGLVFEGKDLWGPEADPSLRVGLDAWESMLDPQVDLTASWSQS
jgi:nitrile hydratase